jgi:hypothetical protein
LFTPFSNWLRDLPAPYDSGSVSLHNLDYIWHYYRDDWFITIEEKQHGGRCTGAQRDTHAIVYQLLKLGSELEKMVRSTMRGIMKRIDYRGHYVIRFEKTTPDDSEWIEINKQMRTKDNLMGLLGTGKIDNA